MGANILSPTNSQPSTFEEDQDQKPPLPTEAEDGRDGDNEVRNFLQLVPQRKQGGGIRRQEQIEETTTTPLFTQHVRTVVENQMRDLGSSDDLFRQYGLLGVRDATYNTRYPDASATLSTAENLIFANMNAPWSTFICGSQGAGKSHTLSCLLENALLRSSPAGTNPNPLAALVFHYDSFTGSESTQLCEAAYLCSSGIPVRVLVSPSNLPALRELYRNLPGLPRDAPRPEVIPLYLQEHHLTVSRMMTLMAVNEGGHVPLYLEVLFKVLRDMSRTNAAHCSLDYLEFKDRLAAQGFSREQKGPLNMRLSLLESFLAHREQNESSKSRLNDMFNSAQATVTIVDLSCPFVNENDACALFSICLSIFMENRGDCGRIVALDEAHKFLTKTGEAEKLTDQVISIVRQQRHLAARIIVATQEPTLAPRLLDLCNVSIVHRFNSPAWFEVLRAHLAGAGSGTDQIHKDLFEMIVGLGTGEALIFCPSALFDVQDSEIQSLTNAFVRVRIRKRVTADGGRSILASAQMQRPEFGDLQAVDVIRPFAEPTKFRPPKIGRPGMSASTSVGHSKIQEPSRAATTDIDPSRILGVSRTDAVDLEPRRYDTRSQTSSTSGTQVAILASDQARPRDVFQNQGTATTMRLEPYLRSAVSESLRLKPKTVKIPRIREEVVHAAGLDKGFFSIKNWKTWSTAIIKDQIVSNDIFPYLTQTY